MLTDDRMAIENVFQSYVRALDGGDIEAYLATMTEDVKLVSAFANHAGKAELAKLIRPLMERRNKEKQEGTAANKGSRHIITNQALEFIDSNNAIMRSYWMTATAPNTGDIKIDSMGSSEDYFIKTDGKWLIRERRISHV